VVEEPGHGDALLQAARQHVSPFGFRIPALGVQLHEVLQLEDLEDGQEICVGDAAGALLSQGVGVYDLLAEGAAGEVRPLGEVKDCVKGGLVDGASVDGPQAAEDAEEGRLAAAVGADD
jgi:hypothetical protein